MYSEHQDLLSGSTAVVYFKIISLIEKVNLTKCLSRLENGACNTIIWGMIPAWAIQLFDHDFMFMHPNGSLVVILSTLIAAIPVYYSKPSSS